MSTLAVDVFAAGTEQFTVGSLQSTANSLAFEITILKRFNRKGRRESTRKERKDSSIYESLGVLSVKLRVLCGKTKEHEEYYEPRRALRDHFNIHCALRGSLCSLCSKKTLKSD